MGFSKGWKVVPITSIIVPIIVEVLRLFTEIDILGMKEGTVFLNCVAMNEDLSSAENMTLPDPSPVQLSHSFCSPQLVAVGHYTYLINIALVLINAIEGYFYMKIFQPMNRLQKYDFQTCKKGT